MARIAGALYAHFDLAQFRCDFRAVLKQRNLTFEQVAQETGVSRRTIDHTLNAASRSSIEVMTDLLVWAGLKFERYVLIQHNDVEGSVA